MSFFLSLSLFFFLPELRVCGCWGAKSCLSHSFFFSLSLSFFQLFNAIIRRALLLAATTAGQEIWDGEEREREREEVRCGGTERNVQWRDPGNSAALRYSSCVHTSQGRRAWLMWKHVSRHVVSRCALTWILGAETWDNRRLPGYYNLPHTKITSQPGGARCVCAATGKQTPVRPCVPTVTSGHPAICQIYHKTSVTFQTSGHRR